MNEATRLLNVGQAASYVGVSAASLRKWSSQGLIPVYRTPGGQRRFSTDDLDDFMRSMRQPLRNGHSASPRSVSVRG
jgi:excisionase family DNA binding protein